MFEEGLVKFLAGQTKVNTFLGTNRGDGTNGIFPELTVKQPNVPYIVYEQIGSETNETLEGVNKFQGATYRLKCYAADYPTAARLAHAVLMVLNGFTGTFADVDATPVQYCTKIHEGQLPTEREERATIWGRYLDVAFLFVDTAS